jgi:hypothetical protein
MLNTLDAGAADESEGQGSGTAAPLWLRKIPSKSPPTFRIRKSLVVSRSPRGDIQAPIRLRPGERAASTPISVRSGIVCQKYAPAR